VARAYFNTIVLWMEAVMPVLLWFMGVPLLVIIALMFTHII
jgi:hypothetical protein